jgi:hypothetical protein
MGFGITENNLERTVGKLLRIYKKSGCRVFLKTHFHSFLTTWVPFHKHMAKMEQRCERKVRSSHDMWLWCFWHRKTKSIIRGKDNFMCITFWTKTGRPSFSFVIFLRLKPNVRVPANAFLEIKNSWYVYRVQYNLATLLLRKSNMKQHTFNEIRNCINVCWQ